MQQSFILAHLDDAIGLTSLLESPPTPGTIVAGIAVAFGFGAVHALAPGHGKTMLSAYLVGARGTAQHALLLGLVTTLSHMLTIFLLGLGALFASQYLLPEQLYPVLSAMSGLTICGVGAGLLKRCLNSEPEQCCNHHHSESSLSSHHYESAFDAFDASDASDASMSSLVTLGVAGGMVPCPSALVLLLSAVALHQTTYGLLLVSSFSAGMAAVLVALGLLIVYAKQGLEQWVLPKLPGQQLSIFSAIVITCAGIGLTVFSIV